VPTVGPTGNKVYDEMVPAILVNGPARLIFSTNAASAAQQVKAALSAILANVETDLTRYQQQYGIGSMKVVTVFFVLNADISNKREQTVYASSSVETDILVMVDDTAIWNPRFLSASLPAFHSEKVGFVGTCKWVKRLRHAQDSSATYLTNPWSQYVAKFWTCMDGLYLVRHNFEIRASNAADCGAFCVSGRSSLIRSSIVKITMFTGAFTNEYVFRVGECFLGWDPVTADDDNSTTRWVINYG
jgi:cellulose synthase/poly-beta-1,6-N-acetylglucosamine synthase-like glycosyltransferase